MVVAYTLPPAGSGSPTSQRWHQEPFPAKTVQALPGSSTAGEAAAMPSDMSRPAVDVLEYPDRYEVYADLPGADRNRLEVWLDGGVLTLRGFRRTRQHPWRWITRERYHWMRRIPLGEGLDADHVEATYADGVLRVELPKRREARHRRVPVAPVRVRPLGARALLRRLPGPEVTRGGIVIPAAARPPSSSGIVVALGDRIAAPLRETVGVGDVVIFDPARAVQVDLQGMCHVFVDQDALIGVVTP